MFEESISSCYFFKKLTSTPSPSSIFNKVKSNLVSSVNRWRKNLVAFGKEKGKLNTSHHVWIPGCYFGTGLMLEKLYCGLLKRSISMAKFL